MANLIKGYAGSGKTTALIKKLKTLLNEGVSADKICIMAMTQDQKYELETRTSLKVKSFDELSEELSKDLDIPIKTRLSAFFCTELIYGLCKEEFKSNAILTNLTKTRAFSRELYTLFIKFKNHRITDEKLSEIIQNPNISKEDKTRFELIIKVFELYNKKLIEENYSDAADIFVNINNAITQNAPLPSSIKNKYSHILIDGAELITQEQLNLAEKIVEQDKIFLYSDKAADFLIKTEITAITELKDSLRNNEILQRAIFLVQNYTSSRIIKPFEETDAIKYVKTEDIQSEIKFIANDIKNKIESGIKASEIAVIAINRDIKQNLIDFLKAENLPINTEIYTEDFQNFKIELQRYSQICETLKNLGIKEFSQQNLAFSNLKYQSLKEIYFDELNLYINNIISETIANPYMKDFFSNIQEETQDTSLPGVIWKNLDKIDDSDKENILREFGLIKKIYTCFLDEDFSDIVKILGAKTFPNGEFFKNKKFIEIESGIKNLKTIYQTLSAPLPVKSIIELFDYYAEETSASKNKINIISMNQKISAEYKHVYIPNLGENDLPQKIRGTYFISMHANEIISAELNRFSDNFGKLIQTDASDIKNDAIILYRGMSRAQKSLMISCHIFEDKKQIQPSIFFDLLKTADEKNYMEPTCPNKDFCAEELPLSATQTEPKTIIPENEKIKLSPSSIANFLKCPKKYYYKNLLGLKEEQTFAASYGTIVHAVMEAFSRQGVFTKTAMTIITEALFAAKNNPGKALAAGLREKDIHLINATDALSLSDMKDDFDEAMEELSESGFFDNPPDKIFTEKNFNFEMPELENIIFEGRIDAIFINNQHCELIDYKTGKTKEVPLSNMLNFLTGSAKEPSDMEKYLQKYDYQIPIYYFAVQNSENLKEIKNQLKSLGLHYIRPKLKDGCKKDFVLPDEIEAQKDKLTQNLKTTVIDNIKDTVEFSSNYDEWNCSECSFAFLCQKERGDTDGED